MKRALLISALLLSGCAPTVTRLNYAEPIQGECNVKVYMTERQALKGGEIEEMCLITGSSSGSFNHSIGTAINKHKDKACECGATNVYVQGGTPATAMMGPATVTMVAFKYVK